MLASVLRTSSSKLRFIGFRNVAEIGLISAFGSLVPLVFHSFGWSEAASWRFGASSFGLLLLLGFLFAIRRTRTLQKPKPNGLMISAIVCVPIIFGLVGANAFFPSEVSGGRHVLAIMGSLAIASIFFLNVAFDIDLRSSSGELEDHVGGESAED
jgi:hypothetical protein